jgi:hypothetical protein
VPRMSPILPSFFTIGSNFGLMWVKQCCRLYSAVT